MDLFHSLLNSVITNNYDTYKIVLENQELKLNSINETELMLKLIKQTNINYLKDLLVFKENKIFYCDFDVIIKYILEENNYEAMKLLLIHENIFSYFNINNIIELSIETNNYDILNKIIVNNLIHFSKNLAFISYNSLLKIKNIESIQFIIDKLENYILIDDTIIYSNIKELFKTSNNIFKIIIKLLEKNIIKRNLIINYDINQNDNLIKYYYKTYYLVLENLKYSKFHLNIDKFDYIYILHNQIQNPDYKLFIKKHFIYCVNQDNLDLLEYIINKFNINNDELIKIIKSIKGIRHQIDLIISSSAKVSNYLYNKLKNYLVENKLTLIKLCISNNNIELLNNLLGNNNGQDINGQDINVKKLQIYLFYENEINKFNKEILVKIFNHFDLLNNKKNINIYLNSLIQNNDKEGISDLKVFMYKYDNKLKEYFFKSVEKLAIKQIKYLFNEADIYDWYFFEWLDVKFNNLHIMEKSIEFIKKKCENLELNLNFIYWYMGQYNKFLSICDIENSLKCIYSNRLENINDFMIEHLNMDYILVEQIKLLLENKESDKREIFILKLYENCTINNIMKLENIDDNMNELFIKYFYSNKKLINKLLKNLVKIKNIGMKIKYIINQSQSIIHLKTNNLIIEYIINNKNYELLYNLDKKVAEEGILFYGKIIKESIKNIDIILFEWAFNQLKECVNYEESVNSIYNGLIKLLLNINYSRFNECKCYNFLKELSQYFENNFKVDIIYVIIIYKFNNNKLIINNFIDEVLNFNELPNNKKALLFNTLLFNINKNEIQEMIIKLNIKNEFIDYLNNTLLGDEIVFDYYLNKKINSSCIDYNLLYKHNIEFILYLKNEGFKFNYFNNDLLIKLFECSLFNRRININFNNTNILNLVNDLSKHKLYTINIDTLNLFLEYYDKIKYKINVNEVKEFVENNQLDINYDSLYFSANSITKDIFDYLRKKSIIDLKQQNEDIFLKVCMNDDVEFAKYLMTIETFDLTINNDNIFCQCCNYGALDTLKWLVPQLLNLDTNAKYEYGICGACAGGYLDVAQWLMETIPDLDIKVDNDYCMVQAVEEGYHDIIDWIMKIEPDRYVIEYNEEYEEIIKFEINRKLIIEENKKKELEDLKECPICYDNKSNIITCCDHQYCYHCFNEYYKKKSNICCPYCRKENIKLFNIII